MKSSLRFIFILLLLCPIFWLSACGSESTSTEDPISELPDFTPSESDAIEGYIANTFTQAGYSISVDPSMIDFSEDGTTLAMGESAKDTFTITNDTSETRTFKLQIYAVSTGFTILNDEKKNLGKWSEIEIAAGSSETFYLQFTGALFGSQTSYVTITADVPGYIRIPARAKVVGDANFKLIPGGYACSSTSAPDLSYLDFMRVAYGNSARKSFKICNTGGESVKIYSYEITNDDVGTNSSAFEEIGIQDVWTTASDTINSAFSSGITPEETESWSEPQAITYDAGVSNPAGNYSVTDYYGESITNRLIPASGFYMIDVDFIPNLDIEADEGFYYEPLAVNATLKLNTSLGSVSIPLVGATAGREPSLEIGYSLDSYTTTVENQTTTFTRPIDLKSDGSAIIFDTVEVFSDWVAENYQEATITVKNSGTGSVPLKFFGGEIEGYFEYTTQDDGSAPVFPITLYAGESETFRIRYLPTPAAAPEDAFWDFGKLAFRHNAPNTTFERELILVGEQDTGTAAEIKYQGANLLKYAGTLESDGSITSSRLKNFCVVATDLAESKTTLSFTVNNNSQLKTASGESNTLTIDWNIKSLGDTEFFDTDSTGVAASGSLSVDGGSSSTFTADIDLAESVTAGTTVKGYFTIVTTFSETVANEYGIDTSVTPITHTYYIPFQAQASDSGTCEFDVSNLDGDAVFVSDRMTMVFTDVSETLRNLPPFKFHMPLHIDKERGIVNLASDITYDQTGDESPVKAIRSYFHQASGITGCAPLPTNPYRLEYQPGSWNGPMNECSNAADGTMTVTTQVDGEVKFYANSACMQANGMQTYTNATTGESKKVFYVEFTKLDEDCNVLYYGKFSTFAFDESSGETIRDVFKRSEESPNENEAYYEDLYGAFQYDSYIEVFDDSLNCGSGTTLQKGVTTDPDMIKKCYKELAASKTNRRVDGFIGECAYFNFNVYTGDEPSDVDSENPDYDQWQSWGTYELHKNEDGEEQEGLYDMTLHNVRIEAFVIGAADRVLFFGHEGHLLYSDLYVTLTTKAMADGDYSGISGDSWKERIAVNTRPHLSKEKVFLKHNELYDTNKYWRNDGLNSMMSNTIDPFTEKLGEGRGAFKVTDSGERIIHRGYPINVEQNGMLGLSGIAAFGGKGNTAPVFTKADSTTGIGKPLYLFFHGCILPGTDFANTQGCMNWTKDSAIQYDSSGNETGTVLEEYFNKDILTLSQTEVEAYNCEEGVAEDEDFGGYNASIACINYNIYGIDRNRQMDYWNPNNNYVYPNVQYGFSDADVLKILQGNDITNLSSYWGDDDESSNAENPCGIGM